MNVQFTVDGAQRVTDTVVTKKAVQWLCPWRCEALRGQDGDTGSWGNPARVRGRPLVMQAELG